ncbi:MAG: hypothetical protein M4579_001197 [Chaenotheca gracillima]|nr:MAG: hypothetical protein M4579_001197 [Chaenotheca gracillima]
MSALKRQRTAKACKKCRALKAKCDGEQPTCSRCAGYGYECIWTSRGGAQLVDGSSDTSALNEAIEAYESIVKELLSHADEISSASTLSALRDVRESLPISLRSPQHRASQSTDGRDADESEEEDTRVNARSYVGKVSDIHFVQMVQQNLNPRSLRGLAGDIEVPLNYNHDDFSVKPMQGFLNPPHLPDRKTADKYVDVYFSTIHAAYPFICKPMFMQRYNAIWNNPSHRTSSDLWLALLYSIFAIGAYYTSFPCRDQKDDPAHAQFFRRACAYGDSLTNINSYNHLCTLLAQCFYLLVTSQTNRCWNILGLGIRVGQGIGLHVEISSSVTTDGTHSVSREMRRRMWYCLYILDHLLALQLGRPVLVSEDDFNVPLPCSVDEENFDVKEDRVDLAATNELCQTTYLLHMVTFSHHVGRVLKQVYRPTQAEISPEKLLSSAESLDRSIMQWRRDLPRHLRFDVGHAFDKNVIHRRQETAQREPRRFASAEEICISEARETARMLHNIVDEQSLMFDFPWWQMISCLVCAASILLVASTHIDSRDNALEAEKFALEDDAKACVGVFKALSKSSVAARRAMDIMESLRNLKELHEEANNGQVMDPTPGNVPNFGDLPQSTIPMADISSGQDFASFNEQFDENSTDWLHLYNDIFDASTWSAQFMKDQLSPAGAPNQQDDATRPPP